MEDDQKNSKWKTTKKIQNGRRPKKIKMEDDQKIQNGRRPKKFKMEDKQKNSKWKTTKKIEIKKNKVNQYNLIKNNPVWLWHRSG